MQGVSMEQNMTTVNPGCGIKVYAVYKVPQQPDRAGQRRRRVKLTQSYGSRKTALWARDKLQDQMEAELKADKAMLMVCEVPHE
jgi:hypothetical protein